MKSLKALITKNNLKYSDHMGIEKIKNMKYEYLYDFGNIVIFDGDIIGITIGNEDDKIDYIESIVEEDGLDYIVAVLMGNDWYYTECIDYNKKFPKDNKDENGWNIVKMYKSNIKVKDIDTEDKLIELLRSIKSKL